QPGGNLREYAGAVARAVGRSGATVGHAGQGLERQGEDVRAALARGPRHEPDTAGVLFAPGVEIRRAAVGPPRSVAVGHACSTAIRRMSPSVACTTRGPRLARRTPRRSSSPSGGAGGPAMTLSGPVISRASRPIVSASLTCGTNRQSAPAAR